MRSLNEVDRQIKQINDFYEIFDRVPYGGYMRDSKLAELNNERKMIINQNTSLTQKVKVKHITNKNYKPR